MAAGGLSSIRAEGKKEPSAPKLSAQEVAVSVLSLTERRNHCQSQLGILSKEIEQRKPLGDFMPSDFDILKQKGLIAKIYKVSKKNLKNQSHT